MSTRLPDAARVAAIIEAVAREEVVPRFRALAAGEIREKSPGQLVTAADIASEAALTRRLTELMPAAVLGEEAAAEDPGLFGLLDTDTPVWVIDPVDGTINFARGQPGFAVIVAWVRAGRTLAGWIHDPLTGVMVTAERGGGAWCAGKRLAVASGVALGDMVGAAYGRIGSDVRSADVLTASGRIGGIVNGMSSGVDYLALALGRAHFQLASRSLPWDHAAGVLIAEEAGATARFLDGRAYDPRVSDGALLSAVDPAAWEAIRAMLLGGHPVDTGGPAGV